MKKQQLFNFALTTMCVAVLSACGSSGGGSLAVENTPTPSANANTGTGTGAGDNSATLAAAQQAVQDAAAKQAAAEEAAKKAQAEADKAKADAANTVQDAQKQLNDAAANLSKALEEAKQQGKNELLAEQEEAERQAAEKEKMAAAEKANPFNQKYLLQNTPAKEGESFVGLKHVVKNNSNLATNSSLVKDSTSDIPTMMTVQGPQRSLDTIVVAERLATKTGDKASRTYLEDFDTRTLNTNAWKALNNEGSDFTDAPDLIHIRKQATIAGNPNPYYNKFLDDKSIGNTAIQHIYINSITTENGVDSPNSNPVIEAERRQLANVINNIDRQVKDLEKKQNEKSDALTLFDDTLNGHLSNVSLVGEVDKDGNHLDAQNAPYGTLGYKTEVNRLVGIIAHEKATTALKQRAQQELDLLTNKRNKLQAALDEATAPIEEKKIALQNAENALNKFNAENPRSTNTAAIDVNRADAATAAKATVAGLAAPNDPIDSATSAGLSAGVIANRGNNNGSALYETKTKTMGNKIGAVWNFSNTDIQNRHQNFTEYNQKLHNGENVVREGFVVQSERDLDGNLIVNKFEAKALSALDAGTVTPDQAPKVGFRTQNNTVAEIYGYRSKALGSYEKPLDEVDNTVEPADILGQQTPANNLPLVNDYKGAKLQHVQYGRVTSALSDRTSTSDFYKDGIKMNDATKTYVASFGEYGEEGTENHFFFRGVNNVGGTELTKLKENTKNGVITYEGHAVTYGLNNNFMGNRDIPTALGNGSGFVSGNHAKAEVNLATNAVTGSIFNKWYDPASPKELRDIDLVQFKGTIADNGNIAGDAVRVDNQTTGLFGAALYGAGAEMGGTVASHDKAAGKHWGGVFGAIRKGVEEAPKQSPQDANSVDQRPQLP